MSSELLRVVPRSVMADTSPTLFKAMPDVVQAWLPILAVSGTLLLGVLLIGLYVRASK